MISHSAWKSRQCGKKTLLHAMQLPLAGKITSEECLPTSPGGPGSVGGNHYSEPSCLPSQGSCQVRITFSQGEEECWEVEEAPRALSTPLQQLPKDPGTPGTACLKHQKVSFCCPTEKGQVEMMGEGSSRTFSTIMGIRNPYLILSIFHYFRMDKMSKNCFENESEHLVKQKALELMNMWCSCTVPKLMNPVDSA